jgi:poly(3-hydroxybutyrate) depolymerase
MPCVAKADWAGSLRFVVLTTRSDTIFLWQSVPPEPGEVWSVVFGFPRNSPRTYFLREGTMKAASVEAIQARRVSLSGATDRKISCMKVIAVLMAVLLGSSLSAALTTTTTTISSSLNPSNYGQPVTFTAVVSSAIGAPPNGETVTFVLGNGTVLGTGTLASGSATFTISTLAPGGTDNVKAKYAGDSTFATSTSAAVAQVVNKAATTTSLTSSPNPSNVGQSVTFTATVSSTAGTATGNVVFNSGGKKLGTASLSSGVAIITTTSLAAGTDAVVATYNGSTSFAASTSNTVNQTVGTAQVVDSTLTWDDVTRYYEVYLPTNLPANPPMLMMLHGTQTQSTPDPQAIISLNWGWQNLANQNGFILVKPASTYNANSRQWNWNAYYMSEAFTSAEVGTCSTAPPENATACPDDAGFLRQLITNLMTQYNVNPNQVYVAGFSSGAQMAQRVGVEISDLVAAVVIGSGTIVGQPSPPPIVLPVPPPGAPPVSIQEWHGTADTEISPCNNNWTGYSGYKFYLATVDQSFNYWTAFDSCSQFANNLPLCSGGSANAATTGNDATSCSNNTEVQFIWEENVGHVWVTGNNSARWQFLSSHPKQSPKYR